METLAVLNALSILLALALVLVSLFLDVLFRKPVEKFVERMILRWDWLINRLVEVPVKTIGGFGLLVAAMIQITPVVMASEGTLNASLVILPFFVIVWEAFVYAVYWVSMKLLRFRFHIRQPQGGVALGRHVPVAVWKLGWCDS